MLQTLCSSKNTNNVNLRRIQSLSRCSEFSNRLIVLLLNHDLRSINTTIMPKAQDYSNQSSDHFRGRG